MAASDNVNDDQFGFSAMDIFKAFDPYDESTLTSFGFSKENTSDNPLSKFVSTPRTRWLNSDNKRTIVSNPRVQRPWPVSDDPDDSIGWTFEEDAGLSGKQLDSFKNSNKTKNDPITDREMGQDDHVFDTPSKYLTSGSSSGFFAHGQTRTPYRAAVASAAMKKRVEEGRNVITGRRI